MIGSTHIALRRFAGRLSGKTADRKGQMTVELCVVLPVVIVIAAILVNVLTFFGECAQFDRVARNSVRLCSSSLSEGADISSVTAEIVALISEEMDGGEVTCESSGAFKGQGYVTYSLEYSYTPTLFGLPLRGSVFGVSMPKITHGIKMAVDPYSPGKWLTSGAI